MRWLAIALLSATTLPAAAQDYYATTAAHRHGNGYSPATVVAGWEKDESFTAIAFTPDGQRANANGVGADWKAVMTTGPRAEAEEEEEEDERYLDREKTTPARPKRTGPPVPRREVVYALATCPAVMTRMQALKPLASFEFDPPGLKGNQDGGAGDGREGLDLWMRVGNAELAKSVETPDSALGRWFAETLRAFEACPATPKQTG